ncbi:hypothetical protein C8Q70DRAFT_479089 [Cubamyces menziesii]|nr:hypothetical protein C8Q70DRAFT_479089 [Cubamyces menziesii]
MSGASGWCLRLIVQPLVLLDNYLLWKGYEESLKGVNGGVVAGMALVWPGYICQADRPSGMRQRRRLSLTRARICVRIWTSNSNSVSSVPYP